METEDFQFDLAIHCELIKWIERDELLGKAIQYPEEFLCFKQGVLNIDLCCISKEYYAEFIEFGFARFCYLLGRKLQLFIGDFFILYDFPAVSFQVRFHNNDTICSVNLKIQPQLYPYDRL